MAEVVARAAGLGGELVLRRDVDGGAEHFEVICNGVFLMDTRDGRSERLLVRAAVEACGGGRVRVLIGGLGVGFSVDEAVRLPAVGDVDVVEREPALLAWHETHLTRFSGDALRDPRVRVICADLAGWLDTGPGPYDVVCLDVDNGPDWTVDEGNAGFYDDDGLAALERVLVPAGVLAVWSAHESPSFTERLRARFGDVRALPVPVRRGAPDVVYLARSRSR